MKTRLTPLVTLLGIATLCWSFISSAADKVTLVLDWSINTNHTGIVVADKLGYFADENIVLRLEAPPQTGASTLVASGSAHLGISSQEELTFARSQGIPLVAVAAIIQHNTSGLAARADSGINRPRAISGKRYGGWGGAVEMAVVQALVEEDGGDFSQVQSIPIGDTDFFAATQNHIDVIWIFEGWDGIAAQHKGVDLTYMPIATIEALDYYTPVLITNEDLIAQSDALLTRSIRAISKGYAFAIDNPEKAAAMLLEHAPELDTTLVVDSQKFLSPQYQDDAPRWGEMQRVVWERFGEWLNERDLLPGSFDPDRAFTNRFLPTTN